MAGISGDVENLHVNRTVFMRAFGQVHPTFSVLEEELQDSIIHYEDTIVDVSPMQYFCSLLTHFQELLKSGMLFVEQVCSSASVPTPLVSILLHEQLGSGKTTLGCINCSGIRSLLH
jgi:hypothetical protein